MTTATQETRMPNARYIGDGVYISHDGYHLILETTDGDRVTNRIGLEPDVLRTISQYQDYVKEFYAEGQHLATPNCEEWGASLEHQTSPISNAVGGEVYPVRTAEGYREVRLCRNCAGIMTQEYMDQLIAKRPKSED